jgi:hypothetical protein
VYRVAKESIVVDCRKLLYTGSISRCPLVQEFVYNHLFVCIYIFGYYMTAYICTLQHPTAI